MVTFSPNPKFNKNATAILFTKEQVKKKFSYLGNTEISNKIREIVLSKYFLGEAGQVFPFVYKKTLIVLIGLGAQKDITPTQLRIQLRKALLSHHLTHSQNIEIIPHRQLDTDIEAMIESIVIGTYQWTKYKKKKSINLKKYILCVSKKAQFEQVLITAIGVNYTRDLVNENADVTNSVFLEKSIRKIIKGCKQVKLEVLNRKELEKKGLGLHLEVNKGSRNEPKLIIVKYTGAPANKNYTALIGKGLTFDTGGLNLKPTGGIEAMKLDMGGAAAVIGVLKNTIKLKLKKNVIFAVGLAENVTGSGSYKPGDVIIGYANKSVEVANTDAEGRLVLADAISYVIKNYKPSRLIDIATLTGACIIALGKDFTGLVTTDDNMAKKLIEASKITDDWAWRLPIYPELKDSVKSQIADIRNLGFPKGAAGAITAAEFLRQFAQGVQWAHLDIAGSSFVDSDERLYFGYGATGSSVRLLTYFLKNNY